MTKLLKKCCEMCEAWGGAEHDYNECDKCPAMELSNENKRLRKDNSRLKNEMSYMYNPLSIGNRHEMGG